MRLVGLWMLLIASPMLAATPVSVLPPHFELVGPDAVQRISVLEAKTDSENTSMADGSEFLPLGPQISGDRISLRSTRPEVVRVEGNLAISVGDGEALIEAVVDEKVIGHAKATVRSMGTARVVNFRNQVQSVLARQGCNIGACHGALSGKGGFRLSLRGYDPETDFFTIAREARGRRIEVSDPGRSLLLAKPTGALPHKGGLRLDVDSRDYRILSEWIASGAPSPADDDAQLIDISVAPEYSRLEKGDSTQILVSAHYDDGRVVDVTHWAKFSSTDEAVAAVDDDGWVNVQGSGEGAILVWFNSQVKLARMRVPYQNVVPDDVFVSSPRRNFIDELNLRQLQKLNLPPSPRCDDDSFLRRVTLDTIGRLPTLAERQAFTRAVASEPIHARDQVIEGLLASDDFVDYWTYRFGDLLLINGNRLRPAAVQAYYRWVHDAVAAGVPWDSMVREILTSQGISTENGATNFYALHQTPEDMTENACQAFMGLSIGCAKCHNHPLEKWTNDQYYAMANLFSRVRAKGWGGETRNGDGIRTLYVSKTGELIQPSTGKPQPPAPLDEPPLAFDDPTDRRIAFANWMTEPENPYFARAITNRVWANFFGRGLVEAVDDLRLSNPASNEPLMSATAAHLVELDFDLRGLIRTILQSETYQRSSLPLEGNAEETKYHSRYYPRRLMAEVLLDAIDQTLATATAFDFIDFLGADRQKTDFYPMGTRAIELYDSSVESYFLKTFGRNPRAITCECERSGEPSMVQVLHLSNGSTLNQKLSLPQSWLSQKIQAGESDEQIVIQLFERALGRAPEEEEQATLLNVISQYQDNERRDALRDAAWSVLTSAEFTFNH